MIARQAASGASSPRKAVSAVVVGGLARQQRLQPHYIAAAALTEQPGCPWWSSLSCSEVKSHLSHHAYLFRYNPPCRSRVQCLLITIQSTKVICAHLVMQRTDAAIPALFSQSMIRVSGMPRL